MPSIVGILTFVSIINVAQLDLGINKIKISRPGPEVINFFHAQLSMKFQLLVELKMLKNTDFSSFQTLRCCLYHAYKQLLAF